jgi:hypothetical protein
VVAGRHCHPRRGPAAASAPPSLKRRCCCSRSSSRIVLTFATRSCSWICKIYKHPRTKRGRAEGQSRAAFSVCSRIIDSSSGHRLMTAGRRRRRDAVCYLRCLLANPAPLFERRGSTMAELDGSELEFYDGMIAKNMAMKSNPAQPGDKTNTRFITRFDTVMMPPAASVDVQPFYVLLLANWCWCSGATGRVSHSILPASSGISCIMYHRG